MTSRAFTAGWLVSATLLSSWAVSSASDQAAPARAADSGASGAQVAAYRLPELSAQIDAEVSRLAARMSAAAAARTPARNLFAFDDRRASRRSNAGRAAAEPLSPEPPNSRLPNDVVTESLRLSGIADTAGILTAVISFRGELHFVKKGDVIAGRYRVDGVRVDGTDIFDLTLGMTLRLSLQL